MRSTWLSVSTLCAALLLTALVGARQAGTGTDVVNETFDDDRTLPTFGRMADDGWSNTVQSGRLVMSKQSGPFTGHGALFSLCDAMEGNFNIRIHVRNDAQVDQIGIAIEQTVDGWVGSSEMYFDGDTTIVVAIGTIEQTIGEVTVEEVNEATFEIIRIAQTMSFSYDIGFGFREFMGASDPILAGPVLIRLFHRDQESSIQPLAGSFDDFSIEATMIVERGADLDWDGIVGVGDLLALLGAWGSCDPDSCCKEDLTNDGVISVDDLLALLGSWN